MTWFAIAALSLLVAFFGIEVLTLQKAVASMSEVLEKNQKAIVNMQLHIKELERAYDTAVDIMIGE